MTEQPTTAAGPEDGPTWRALEVAMKRYLDTEPGNRDWMPVQEALWERDRFHAAEAREQDALALAAAIRLHMLGRRFGNGFSEQDAERLLAALPPSAPPALDVERLAVALHETLEHHDPGPRPHDHPTSPTNREIASRILARLEQNHD